MLGIIYEFIDKWRPSGKGGVGSNPTQGHDHDSLWLVPGSRLESDLSSCEDLYHSQAKNKYAIKLICLNIAI